MHRRRAICSVTPVNKAKNFCRDGSFFPAPLHASSPRIPPRPRRPRYGAPALHPCVMRRPLPPAPRAARPKPAKIFKPRSWEPRRAFSWWSGNAQRAADVVPVCLARPREACGRRCARVSCASSGGGNL